MGGVCRYPLKGCTLEYTEQSTHFESFNDECAIVREVKDANLLSHESKLMRVNLQLNLYHSCLKTDTFSIH